MGEAKRKAMAPAAIERKGTVTMQGFELFTVLREIAKRDDGKSDKASALEIDRALGELAADHKMPWTIVLARGLQGEEVTATYRAKLTVEQARLLSSMITEVMAGKVLEIRIYLARVLEQLEQLIEGGAVE